MPVKRLPSNPNLDHLKYQAKDLLKAHAARHPEVAQRLREFHPRFARATDAAIFDAQLKLSDAQLAIARESGFPSWARLKNHIEKTTLSDHLDLPHHERIEDATFRRAVDLLDAGDVTGLCAHLKQHPDLAHQHVVFEGGNYFRNPTLLEFVAENPVRHGRLPGNIVQVAKVVLDAGAEQSALNETLMLVSTGSVPRECRVQLPLVDLLCDHGADPNSAIHAAALHGELEAVNALIGRGARIDLPVAATARSSDRFACGSHYGPHRGRPPAASKCQPWGPPLGTHPGIRLWPCRGRSIAAGRGRRSEPIQPGWSTFPYDTIASGSRSWPCRSGPASCRTRCKTGHQGYPLAGYPSRLGETRGQNRN